MCDSTVKGQHKLLKNTTNSYDLPKGHKDLHEVHKEMLLRPPREFVFVTSVSASCSLQLSDQHE